MMICASVPSPSMVSYRLLSPVISLKLFSSSPRVPVIEYAIWKQRSYACFLDTFGSLRRDQRFEDPANHLYIVQLDRLCKLIAEIRDVYPVRTP